MTLGAGHSSPGSGKQWGSGKTTWLSQEHKLCFGKIFTFRFLHFLHISVCSRLEFSPFLLL
jgi:hypothetical protein